MSFFFFQAEDGIRDSSVTGVQTCALPISSRLRVRANGWNSDGSQSATDELHELDSMRVVLGHGASGNAASMKPYVDGFKRRGIDAVAVDLPRGGAERAVPVFIKTSGRGHD